jgi:Bd3614-like deaminase
MNSSNPAAIRILSSEQDFFWTHTKSPTWDYFGFAHEGAGALLLLAMHLRDKMPWRCARNPLEYNSSMPGVIDLESKRLLAKRYRLGETSQTDCNTPTALPLIEIDLMTEFQKIISASGHDFSQPIIWPELPKIPGRLMPRAISAVVDVTFSGNHCQFHARNLSEHSQCLHAELTILLRLSTQLANQELPPEKIDSFKLHCTLKPCRMCAAFLYFASERCVNFQVSFDNDDPGRLASKTLLDRYGYFRS